MGAAALLLAFDSEAKIPRQTRSLGSCSGFASYDQIEALLDGYEQTYPEIARSFSIGSSVEGREIRALKVSSDPDAESEEPEIRIIGAIHGDECISASVVLEIIEWIIGGYGDDQLASDLVDGAEILFVPVINPDGYSGQVASRLNSNGVDLNRNLGFGWVSAGGSPFSQPETAALRNASQNSSFVLGLSYHTLDSYVNGPWNYTPHHPLDEALISAIGQGYKGGSGYNVVFGWDWYAIEGDVNDWSLGAQGTFDWTIELMSDIDLQWQVHGPGMESFLSYVFLGVEGLVVDAKTSKPLAARIIVNPPGEPVFTDPDVGDYHRILLPGTYDITAVANGYVSRTKKSVVVAEGGLTTVDFDLEPEGPCAGFAILEMTLPQTIPNGVYSDDTYLNNTLASDALGEDDGRFYSLSPEGTITLDMGENFWIGDLSGPDLEVVSGTGSYDPVSVLVSDKQDGPFFEVASGSGDIEADISLSGLDKVRFVRLQDLGAGPFNAEFPGYDLDAVNNLHPVLDRDTGADTDADSEIGDDDDQDAGSDGDSDADADSGAKAVKDGGKSEEPTYEYSASAGGCSCAVIGASIR